MYYVTLYGYTCDEVEYYGYDCSEFDECGGCDAEVDPCAEAGGQVGWLGDGYCDGSNNQEACGYDGGDCCPSTCVDGTYSCDSYGGTCDTCVDPGAEDANYGGSCADGPVCGDGVCDEGEIGGDSGCYADCGCLEGEYECVAGGSYGNCIPGSWQCDGYDDCADVADEADCGDLTCEDQGLWDCGDGQCIPTSYVCDGSSEFCNAGWGPDCANGADEGLDVCDYEDECSDEECNEGITACDDGYNGDCDADGYLDDDTAICWYYVTAFGYTCEGVEYYGFDCSEFNDCGGCDAEVDPCVEAGGTVNWLGDGYCDSNNNQEACGYDSGDCCPGDCVDYTYDCETYGGDCSDCIDPNTSDFDEGGACDEVVLCEDPDAYNYGAEGDCVYVPEGWTCPESYAFDTWCDCGCGAYDATCDDPEASQWDNCGDLGCVDPTSTDCNEATEWDASITGLTATTSEFDYYGDGSVMVPSVMWDWDDLSDGTACEDNGLVTCADGSCASSEDDCPEIPYADCLGNVSWIGDGYCDGGNNNAECGWDAGDCCPGDCEALVADACPDNPDGCYSTISCGDCATCEDPDSADNAAGGQCEDYEQWTDAECAVTVTIAGSGDLDGDGYNDDCYDDGTGYFSFNWEGGCAATNLYYVDSDGVEQNLDLSAYGFTSGFFFYGFGFNEELPFIVSFGDASSDLIVAMTDCEAGPEGCSEGLGLW
jgi:hypothetical protein